MAESTALAVIDNTVTGVTVFDKAGGVDDIVAKIRKEVAATPRDISTPQGRKAIASLAYKIARTKTGLDGLGKDLVADKKAAIATVDRERTRLWDELEALQAEVRKPLDEFEAKEKTRIESHEAALLAIPMTASFLDVEPTAAELKIALDNLEVLRMTSRNWEEFQARADLAFADAFRTLNSRFVAATQREKERAELEEFRRQQADREQKARDEAIAAEAAAKAKREAEETAAAEAAEKERLANVERERVAAETAERERLARIERERLEREASEAKVREETAAREKAAALEQVAAAERQRVADAEQAERERVANEAKAEETRRLERIAADKRTAEAVEAEKARAAAAAKKLEDEAKARAADAAHKAAVLAEAADGLIRGGYLPGKSKAEIRALAIKIIADIAAGNIAAVTISY